jgi:hypothetical protein
MADNMTVGTLELGPTQSLTTHGLYATVLNSMLSSSPASTLLLEKTSVP